jgi:hypothetical protein
MPFSYLLTNLLVEVPGAVGAIFLDAEGESVEWVSQHHRDPYDLKVEGAYHSIFKRQLEEATASSASGSLCSYIFSGRNFVTLTQLLPDGYYVLLVVRRTGLPALAHHHLRRVARTIAEELSA